MTRGGFLYKMKVRKSMSDKNKAEKTRVSVLQKVSVVVFALCVIVGFVIGGLIGVKVDLITGYMFVSLAVGGIFGVAICVVICGIFLMFAMMFAEKNENK